MSEVPLYCECIKALSGTYHDPPPRNSCVVSMRYAKCSVQNPPMALRHCLCRPYRGTSLTRNCASLGPYSTCRPMPRSLLWS